MALRVDRAPKRGLSGVTILFVAAVALFASTIALAFDAAALHDFAERVSLADRAGFVEAVGSLRQTKTLPPRYITKKEAEAAGWKPGADLCRIAPGRVIGGDPFLNREKRLPERAGRSWHEADLDPQCGRRGAKRLVFSGDGLIYLTTDHYKSFTEVPQ
jgi:hypothetical protein